ncbi:hypothetical protein P5V15_010277 [Pogonomyrmex californicus]
MANDTQEKNISDERDMEVDTQDHGYDMDEEGGLRVDDEIYIPPPLKNFNETDTSGSRLMIIKIVNENFKSYAGAHVIGPFQKSFSAIVGPNGSGKSNVIDSMLFVFGYRASKIRSKKVSVLIHNSSEHPNLNSCTVSIYFQRIIDKPGEDYDIVPGSEFVISRTAFKDSSSYYELNKKKVQFKEIAKLLRFHGVDLDHNRFLILQGEVEQIALMKPKAQNENDTGMLEFLEDIIGTSRYKEPLEKLTNKVEELTELRVEKLHRLKVVQKEKEALEEPMQEAVQYLKTENAIIQLQHQLYQCKKSEAIKELAECVATNDNLEKEQAALTNEMSNVRQEKGEKIKIIKEKNKKWDVLQQQKDEATTSFNEIRKQDELLHAELVETNKRRKANMATTKTEKNKLEELLKVPEKNAKDIEECEHLIETNMVKKEKEEASLATLMMNLREKTEPLLNERSKLEQKLISLRKNVDQAKAAYDIAQSELQLYISVEKIEKEKLESLRESLERTVSTLKERQKQLALFETKIPATENSLEQAQSELNEVKALEMEKTAQLQKMRITYEEQRFAMQASTSRNRILDALMREKREGRIPGILGRLGDLGAINAQYDVAVSTACGPLDDIVVDTVTTAQACITFLREHNIGRATFIALEKQQRFQDKIRHKIQTPENVPRLFDLIKVVDERVLLAFYYGLQDTLVAKDLDQATRIAYGRMRYRVVTLKGELIELSGTMSGGGRTVLRGRMGQKVMRNEPSTADIEKLQSQLDTVFEECNKLKARQQPLEQQVHVLSIALRDMKVDRQKFGIEVQALSEQEPSLRAQLKMQEKHAANSVSDPKKVAQLQKAVDTAKLHLEEVEENSASVEKEVECINKKIDEISGSKVRDQQAKIAQLTKSIDKAKAEICRLQVAIKTAERNVKKTEKNIETLESDVHTCEQRLRDIQKEKSELEEHAKVILEKLKEINEKLEERDDSTASLKDELNELQTREDKMKATKIDLDQKLHESKKQLKELQLMIPEYNRRIAKLELHAIPHESIEPLKDLTEEEVDQLDMKIVMQNLQRAKKRLPEQIPNMQIIADYQVKDALYMKRASELEETTSIRNKMRDIYESARRRRIQEFLHGFTLITTKLKEMYQMITLGGDAELELVDSLDPLSEGIVFSVRPPKKSWKSIDKLSGGEKTLSSLALVFALHHYKPTPLYFMDEIDAALDFKNVSIVGNYIKERTKNAQFIVISLRSNMFELADSLVGIYKTFNCSKTVTLHLSHFYKNNSIVPPTQLTSKSYASQATQKSKLFSQRTQQNSHKENTAPVKNNNVKRSSLSEDETSHTQNKNANRRSLNREEMSPAKNNNTKNISVNGDEISPMRNDNAKKISLNMDETSLAKNNNVKNTLDDKETNVKNSAKKTRNGKRLKIDQQECSELRVCTTPEQVPTRRSARIVRKSMDTDENSVNKEPAKKKQKAK